MSWGRESGEAPGSTVTRVMTIENMVTTKMTALQYTTMRRSLKVINGRGVITLQGFVRGGQQT